MKISRVRSASTNGSLLSFGKRPHFYKAAGSHRFGASWGRWYVLLGILGAMTLPPQAAAETAQERAAQNGWTITADDQPVVPMTTVAKSCPNARAKRAGSAIRDYANRVMVYGRIALKVGAANGRIILCGRGQAYGSPGRGWSGVYGPWMSVRRPCCHDRHLRWRFEMQWVWRRGVIDQYWTLNPLEIGAHVRKGTDHTVFWDVRRVWF